MKHEGKSRVVASMFVQLTKGSQQDSHLNFGEHIVYLWPGRVASFAPERSDQVATSHLATCEFDLYPGGGEWISYLTFLCECNHDKKKEHINEY